MGFIDGCGFGIGIGSPNFLVKLLVFLLIDMEGGSNCKKFDEWIVFGCELFGTVVALIFS